MERLTCDADGLTKDRLQRLTLKEEVDGQPYNIQVTHSSIITQEGNGHTQVELSTDNPLPDAIQEDFAAMYKPRFARLLDEMNEGEQAQMAGGVQQMSCQLQFVESDNSAFAMPAPLTFLEGVGVSTSEGHTVDFSMREVADVANAIGMDTPQLWMPPPSGFVQCLVKENEERLDMWRETMRHAPTRYGRVDHKNTIVAVLGSYRDPDEKELKWML